MENTIPKWVFKLLSYISAFTYGGYVFGYTHGNSPELHRWVLTGLFGIMFYAMSLPEKYFKSK